MLRRALTVLSRLLRGMCWPRGEAEDMAVKACQDFLKRLCNSSIDAYKLLCRLTQLLSSVVTQLCLSWMIFIMWRMPSPSPPVLVTVLPALLPWLLNSLRSSPLTFLPSRVTSLRKRIPCVTTLSLLKKGCVDLRRETCPMLCCSLRLLCSRILSTWK